MTDKAEAARGRDAEVQGHVDRANSVGAEQRAREAEAVAWTTPLGIDTHLFGDQMPEERTKRIAVEAEISETELKFLERYGEGHCFGSDEAFFGTVLGFGLTEMVKSEAAGKDVKAILWWAAAMNVPDDDDEPLPQE